MRAGFYATMRADENYVSILSKLRDMVAGQAENVDVSRTMLALGYEIEAHGKPRLSNSRYRIVTLRARYICNDYLARSPALAVNTKAALPECVVAFCMGSHYSAGTPHAGRLG